MPHRFALALLAAIALWSSVSLGDVIEVPGQPLYTLEYQWGPQIFIPLDTTQSDTVWGVRRNDTTVIRIRFFQFPLPTMTRDCNAFYMRMQSTLLSGYSISGLRFQIFPRDSGEADTFRFYPNTYWGQLYTYHECPIGVADTHQVPWPPGDEVYMAWLLNHDYPQVTDLVVGVMPWPGDTQLLGDFFSLFWDTTEQSSLEPLLPAAFDISPCYSNPFNGITAFELTLPTASRLTVTVSDILGRQVAVLADGVNGAGRQRIFWHPDVLASGLYFINVATPFSSRTLRAVFQK